jgi:hypothetical protein
MAEDDSSNKEEATTEEDKEDPRVDFMFSILQRSMQIKPDKWTKLLENKDLSVSIFLSLS